jgi:hypothetical protein
MCVPLLLCLNLRSFPLASKCPVKPEPNGIATELIVA